MKRTAVPLIDGGTMAIPNAASGGDGDQSALSSLLCTRCCDHEEGIYLFDTGFHLAYFEKHTPQDDQDGSHHGSPGLHQNG
jgi:hypothetical protein